jgi:hypothetical protein
VGRVRVGGLGLERLRVERQRLELIGMELGGGRDVARP